MPNEDGQLAKRKKDGCFVRVKPGRYKWLGPNAETNETIDRLFSELKKHLKTDKPKAYGLCVDLTLTAPPPRSMLRYINEHFLALPKPPAHVAFIIGTNTLINKAAEIAVKPVLGQSFKFYKTEQDAYLGINDHCIKQGNDKINILSTQNSIIRRISAMMVVKSLAIAITLIFFFQYQSLKTARQHALELLETDAQVISTTHNHLLQEAVDDLFFLRNTPPILAIAKAQDSKVVEDASAEIWKNRLEVIFKSFAKAKKQYHELRFIGVADNGKELVRVNNYDAIEVVPKSGLQQKQHREYFTGSVNLKPNEHYVGNVTLRIEHNKLVTPLTPQLRIAAPVYYKGSVFGIIVVNLDYQHFLASLQRFIPPTFNWIISDSRGNILRHPNPDKVTYLAKVDPPALSKEFKNFDSLLSSTAPVKFSETLSKQDYLGVHVNFPVAAANATNIYSLTLFENETVLRSSISSIRNQSLVIVGVVLLVALVLILIYLRHQLYPIRLITESLANKAALELPTRISQDTSEIGTLARAISNSLSKIATLNRNLNDAQETAKIGSWHLDVSTEKLSWTDQMFNIFPEDINEGEPELSRLLETIYPPDRLYWAKHLERCLSDGLPYSVTFRVGRDNTNFKWVRAHGKGVFDSSGRVIAIQGTCQDISDQKKHEIELDNQKRISQHQSKLASIGELAAGVGHEINNPLAIADGNINKIRKDLQKRAQLTEENRLAFDKYKAASARISNIVQGLRTFARADIDKVAPFDLTGVVAQTLGLLGDIYVKEGIKLIIDIPDQPIFINGNLGRFQQALMNLITNARDAVREVPHPQIGVTLTSSAQLTTVSVTDNGKGIADELKEKIFDNFFTTKAVGKGTGLGLGLSAMIAKEHKGTLDFVSELGKQTTFTLTLPRMNEIELLSLKPKEQPAEQKGAAITELLQVLVVDDEDDIRDILKDILEDHKCTVHEAANGIEALEKIHKHQYDIIFTDMKMPKMDGPTLLREITSLNLNPKPTLIALTGGVTTDFSKKGSEELSSMIDGFVFKPFEEEQITNILSDSSHHQKKAA